MEISRLLSDVQLEADRRNAEVVSGAFRNTMFPVRQTRRAFCFFDDGIFYERPYDCGCDGIRYCEDCDGFGAGFE